MGGGTSSYKFPQKEWDLRFGNNKKNYIQTRSRCGDYQMFENTAEVRILPSGYIFLTIYSPSGHLIQIKLNGTESIGDKTAWLLYVFNGDGFDKITVDGALDMTGDEYIFDEYD